MNHPTCTGLLHRPSNPRKRSAHFAGLSSDSDSSDNSDVASIAMISTASSTPNPRIIANRTIQISHSAAASINKSTSFPIGVDSMAQVSCIKRDALKSLIAAICPINPSDKSSNTIIIQGFDGSQVRSLGSVTLLVQITGTNFGLEIFHIVQTLPMAILIGAYTSVAQGHLQNWMTTFSISQHADKTIAPGSNFTISKYRLQYVPPFVASSTTSDHPIDHEQL